MVWGMKLWLSVIGSIFLLYFTYSESEFEKWPFVLIGILILLSKSVRNNKIKMRFDKILACIFFIAFMFTLVGGYLYKTYCPEKVEMRRLHLFSAAESFALLPDARLQPDYYFIRSFAQIYSIRYLSNMDAETIKRHYIAEFKRLGYDDLIGNGHNRLKAKKDGMIVIIEWEKGRVTIRTEFDDYFQRWNF